VSRKSSSSKNSNGRIIGRVSSKSVSEFNVQKRCSVSVFVLARERYAIGPNSGMETLVMMQTKFHDVLFDAQKRSLDKVVEAPQNGGMFYDSVAHR